MKNKKTLILSGMGLNCERETAHACRKSGANEVVVLHILRFLEGKANLKDYDFIVFIGGFLDGDYLGSARVAANRLKFWKSGNLKEQLVEFVDKGNLLLGICNGFQLLVKSGFLPDEKLAFKKQTVSLTKNKSSVFEDRWVYLKVNPENNNAFTRGIDRIYLPVRHGEGRIVVGDQKTEDNIRQGNNIAMFYADEQGNPSSEYPLNPNGSWRNVAALSNSRGNVMGIMPHPEAYAHYTNHPRWTRMEFKEEDGEGLKIFKNAYKYLDAQYS